MRGGRAPVVAVIGAAECTPEQAAAAEAVGRGLALRGAVLVSGGQGGVMEAASRGAREAGGLVIGILQGSQPTGGNAYLSVALPTGLGHARNAVVVLSGKAVIAIGGGPGTLSEIGLALKSDRRVIGLGTWQLNQPDGASAAILVAASPDEAVALALSENGGSMWAGDE
jgi:uncharacterized protein (TIGR00725 family)